MNRLRTWIESVLQPEETNLKEGALEDILKALESPAVRKLWIKQLMDELWQLNIGLDRLMEAEEEGKWRRITARRNSIVFCLNEILTARDLLDSELVEQERRDRLMEQFKGVAAPIDSRR